jgi:RNA polymerase sigma-70 factor (ECF subfamily)
MNASSAAKIVNHEMDSPRSRFAALLDEHRGIVFKVASSYCTNAEDRRDLAQEIAAQAWRSFPGYDASRPFSTWMYRIALNVAISFARSAGRRALATPLEEHHEEQLGVAADDRAAQSEESDRRVRALHAVIERQQPLDRALLLLWLEERSQREIAEVLGLSESNVSTKLHRLKQRIREQLAELDAE